MVMTFFMSYLYYAYMLKDALSGLRQFFVKMIKMAEKCFPFHLKSSFRSQGIKIFVPTFRLRRKF